MSKFDQRDQKVGTQFNINLSLSDQPTARELIEVGVKLINAREYIESLEKFRQAISLEPYTPDAQYYIALALQKGQRPRLLSLATIQEIERRLSTAIQQDGDCSHAYVLWAIVKEDYYVMNRMYNTRPSPADLLGQIKSPIKATHVGEMLAHIRAPQNRVWEWLHDLS